MPLTSFCVPTLHMSALANNIADSEIPNLDTGPNRRGPYVVGQDDVTPRVTPRAEAALPEVKSRADLLAGAKSTTSRE